MKTFGCTGVCITIQQDRQGCLSYNLPVGILTISAQPGLRADEIVLRVAQDLNFELVTQARLDGLYQSEFAGEPAIPARGYADIVTSMVACLASEHALVFCGPGGPSLFRNFPDVLRVMI